MGIDYNKTPPRVFKKWLQLGLPAEEMESLKGAPGSYLEIFYPNIYNWGPNGDRFVEVLEIMKKRLGRNHSVAFAAAFGECYMQLLKDVFKPEPAVKKVLLDLLFPNRYSKRLKRAQMKTLLERHITISDRYERATKGDRRNRLPYYKVQASAWDRQSLVGQALTELMAATRNPRASGHFTNRGGRFAYADQLEAFQLFAELVCNRDIYAKLPEAAAVLEKHDSFVNDYIDADKAGQPKSKKSKR